MFKILNKKIKVILVSFMVLILTTLLVVPGVVFAAASFKGGDMFKVSNTNSPAWMDPVNANVGDIVEFHLEIVNSGDQTANNVRVQAELPTNVTGGALQARIHVRADNAPEFVETATIDVPSSTTAKSLGYFGGHAVFTKHPGNQQTSIEAIGTGAEVALGDLQVGSSYFFEVQYKAKIIEIAAPTLTPTPTGVPNTPTPTPTGVPPTATPTPTGTPVPPPPPGQGAVLRCPDGTIERSRTENTIVCINQQQQTIVTLTAQGGAGGSASATGGNASISGSGNSTVNVGASAGTRILGTTQSSYVTSLKELPRTGLPLAAWVLAGLLPGGLGIKRLFKDSENKNETPHFLSQVRNFKKED